MLETSPKLTNSDTRGTTQIAHNVPLSGSDKPYALTQQSRKTLLIAERSAMFILRLGSDRM